MSNIAFIPVRGGSKSIPLKNIKVLYGKPLVYWTVNAAQNSNVIDKVIVATDHIEIKNTVLSFNFDKVEVYDRLAENAQDTSSTESVMLEYIECSNIKDDDNFFLIQATSPLLTSLDIDNMYSEMFKNKYDSALSCVLSKRFYWTKSGKSINYDYMNRPRRQDFDGYMMENGACYISSVENIKKSKNRLFGKIYV
ncbi:cytidylyltransferase domain-containing protein, partial [Brachyspira hampsonii]